MTDTSTKIQTVDYQKALDLLKQAVDEKGADYVYPKDLFESDGGCRYFDDEGAPMCIVGNAISRLGVAPHEVVEWRTVGDQVNWPLWLTPKALGLWEAAQSYQDNGLTWGEAVEGAATLLFGEAEGK